MWIKEALIKAGQVLWSGPPVEQPPGLVAGHAQGPPAGVHLHLPNQSVEVGGGGGSKAAHATQVLMEMYNQLVQQGAIRPEQVAQALPMHLIQPALIADATDTPNTAHILHQRQMGAVQAAIGSLGTRPKKLSPWGCVKAGWKLKETRDEYRRARKMLEQK